NVRDRRHGSTYCHACGELLIDRDWYEIHRYGVVAGCCGNCGAAQPGRFSDTVGRWGRKRKLVDMRRFSGDQAAIPAASPAAARPMQSSMLDLQALSAEHCRIIQRIAQQVVAAAVLDLPLQDSLFAPLGTMAEQQVYGLFTTLRRDTHLRGCCGFLGQPLPLRDALILSGRRTACDDHRMPAISGIELPYLSCHVQLLATPAQIPGPAASRRDAITVGQHGLRISGRANGRFANRAGLLLPSVPVEQGWNLDAFLQAICRKAGLPDDAWCDEDTILERFEGFKISGGFERSTLPEPIPAAAPPGDRQSLMGLHELAVRQLISLSQGGTPEELAAGAMAAGAMDGTVNAVILTAYNQDSKAALCHCMETSLRPGIQLQTTLAAMCRVVDQMFRTIRFEGKVNLGVAISVFHDPADHGITTADDWEGEQLKADLPRCDLRGTDPASRAVLARCGERAAIAFDAAKPMHQLVGEAAALVRDGQQPISISTLAYLSPISGLLAASSPPTPGPETIRQPVLADAFYPADALTRAAMVQGFEQQSHIQPSEATLALLTPHAGLRYSGRIAMDAWRSAPLDRTLVIIGPKHRAEGADWAVSPASAWQLPGGWRVDCDRELAQAIVAGVAGMGFDAATHQHEHAVEVQLPILEQLSRHQSTPPRIVSIAMAAGSWPQIQAAAGQLAAVLSSRTPRPLLVISSDLNHFADEAENRRRDGLALAALKSTDPQALLETCRNEQISMCGVAAAALVLETLHRLNESFEIEQLHYNTSAAVTGDSSRVVGYAACRLLASSRR
ncbi:MAG: AmmeMemoRadiSam system protein B, partial [Synechococcaceae cyanobacterium]|nr:AmmeMemoRadiSam system protein B [Synechococcaceae cyanobacterium]